MKKEDIIIKYDKGEFPAYLISTEKTDLAVILIEEIWGLNNHIKDVSERVASLGYTVLAPELLGDTGIFEKISPEIYMEMRNPETRDEAQKKMREATAPLHTPEFGNDALAKLQVAFNLLKNRKISKIGIMGFCFGGTYSYAFTAVNPELKACIAFYGQPPLDKVSEINCPVMGFYGEKDKRLIDSLPQLEMQMKEYNKDFTYKVYKNTGHAFFNNTNKMTYNKEAAEDAWKMAVDFLKKNLG
jgi:carboxymethylenebutenolidase